MLVHALSGINDSVQGISDRSMSDHGCPATHVPYRNPVWSQPCQRNVKPADAVFNQMPESPTNRSTVRILNVSANDVKNGSRPNAVATRTTVKTMPAKSRNGVPKTPTTGNDTAKKTPITQRGTEIFNDHATSSNEIR